MATPDTPNWLQAPKPQARELLANAMRNAAIAQRSYEYGWAVDPKRTEVVTTALETEIQKREAELQAFATTLGFKPTPRKSASKKAKALGIPFNPRSSMQLAELFYDFLHEPIRVRTGEGAESTGASAIQALKTNGIDPRARAFAAQLEAWKPLVTLRDHFIAKMRGVDLVRPKANVSAQLSGRWSYTDPPLQTTPPKVRPIFVPRPGRFLVTADYNALELRIVAQLAGDEKLCSAFLNNRDLHTANAMDLFGVSEAEGATATYRDPAKTFVYALNYSECNHEIAARGIHEKLVTRGYALTYRSVLDAVERWWLAHPKIWAWKLAAVEHAETKGYVEEPFTGRQRWFYGQSKATEAMNFPIQSSGASVMDQGAQGVDSALRWGEEGLLLQCHDALYLEGPDPYRLCCLLWEHMRQEREVQGVRMPYDIEMTVYADAWNGKQKYKFKTIDHAKEALKR